MAVLKKEVKLFIVRSLAVFNTPTETAELVHQDYGVVVTKQQCEKYDPTKRSGENLSPELKAEFEATREEFLEKPKTSLLQIYQYVCSVWRTNIKSMARTV